jgi:hypothetical protein
MSQRQNNCVKPLSLRLNFEQRSTLVQEADGLPLSTYIKLRLFGRLKGAKDTRVHRPVKDRKELGSLLGKLGKSRIANNLQELVDAAESGSLIMDAEANDTLQKALKDIRDIRLLLIAALGLRN